MLREKKQGVFVPCEKQGGKSMAEKTAVNVEISRVTAPKALTQETPIRVYRVIALNALKTKGSCM